MVNHEHEFTALRPRCCIHCPHRYAPDADLWAMYDAVDMWNRGETIAAMSLLVDYLWSALDASRDPAQLAAIRRLTEGSASD